MAGTRPRRGPRPSTLTLLIHLSPRDAAHHPPPTTLLMTNINRLAAHLAVVLLLLTAGEYLGSTVVAFGHGGCSRTRPATPALTAAALKARRSSPAGALPVC